MRSPVVAAGARRWSVSAWPSALCGIGRQELGGQERTDHQRPVPATGNGGAAAQIVLPTIYLPAESGAHIPYSIPAYSVRGGDLNPLSTERL
jgi:hypothetical protein